MPSEEMSSETLDALEAMVRDPEKCKIIVEVGLTKLVPCPEIFISVWGGGWQLRHTIGMRG